ncbi:MAG: hypothetical protein Kow0077_12080 [Anaerolineae bacterium]
MSTTLKHTLKQTLPAPVWKTLRQSKKRTEALLCRTMLSLVETVRGIPESICLLYDRQELTPETMIMGYLQGMGIFVDPTNGQSCWMSPDPRGIVPIEGYHVEKELRRIIRQGRFEMTVNRDFAGVVAGCAEPRPGQNSTFIVPELIAVYQQLHEIGLAHSVEAWKDGELVGGVFGLTFGAYFIGESQFHRMRNAGKVAFVYLMEILRDGGFLLHDAFWASQHLIRFGAYEVPAEVFRCQLARAVVSPAQFGPLQGIPFPERFRN